jgi:ATP-dependent Clp protease ATP-binding subunit ClpC
MDIKDMKGNVTPKLKEIIKIATSEAKAYDYRQLLPEHLLLAILLENQNRCIDIMSNMRIDIDNIFNEVSDYLNSSNLLPPIAGANREIPPSSETKYILEYAVNVSSKMGAWDVDVEHVMVSLLLSDSKAKNILSKNRLEYNDFINKLYDENQKNENMDDELNEYEMTNTPQNKTIKAKGSRTPVLDNFCDDLTKRAEAGLIDSVIGRDEEIKRVSQILCRRKKNNPVIIGSPGVGKSSIAEGLALMMVEGTCPSSLLDKKLYSLNIGAVVAGTKYRGQFEERMKGIIKELTENKEIILFIDELHTMVGAGNTSGSQDMSNIVKPALSRGDMQVIGATTLDEFREHIEKDGALSRRFQQVIITEPTIEETVNILMRSKEKYEDHHKVRYSEETIRECVKLSDRYITDRAMPDKAFDVLDECGAMTNIDRSKPEKLIELETKLKNINIRKDEVVKKQQYELAADLKQDEKTVESLIRRVTKDWKESLNKDRCEITPRMVAEAVASITKIPVKTVDAEETTKLAEMGEVLKGSVIGQDEAISKVCKAIQRNKLGIGDTNKPIGSFIFLGSTGVGKTHLTKVINEYLFGREDSLIRIDMGEFGEKFSTSNLVGAPAGYVGFEKGGKLTEKVRKNPYSVILFDEIEKAHPDTFNILLSILDEGHLTDSLGRKINFKNTLIIMTSNIGVKEVNDFGKGIGFSAPSSVEDDKKRVEGILTKSLKKGFKPEFLNRLDEVIIFNQLKEEDILKMVNIEVKKLKSRLKERNFEITFTKGALTHIAKKGYSKEYGARPLKRTIQDLVETKIVDEILSGNLKEGDTLKVGVSKGNSPTLTFKI